MDKKTLLFFIKATLEDEKYLGDNLKKQCIDYVDSLVKENQKPQIFIDTQNMEEEYGNGLYQDYLEKENQELKQKYLNAVADYETTMAEKEQLNSLVNSCQEEIRQLKKQLEEHKNKYIKRFEKLLAEDVEPDPEDLYMAELEQRAMDCEAMKIQQKEFIKYLEDEIERLPGLTTLFYRNAKNKLIGHTEIVQGAYKEILQKYKEIVNGTEQN